MALAVLAALAANATITDRRAGKSKSFPLILFGESPPLDARTLVLSGGERGSGFQADMPVACGVPVIQVTPGGADPTTEIVAAISGTRAAGVDLGTVVRDPTTRRAARARRSAAGRLRVAGQRLHSASALATGQLEQADASSGDRRMADRATSELDGAQAVVRKGFRELRAELARECLAQGRREAQRRAAQVAAEEEEAEAAAPGPIAEPTPAPAPAPEPVPSPAPSPPSVEIE